jgi:hypothetical protein
MPGGFHTGLLIQADLADDTAMTIHPQLVVAVPAG